MGSSWGAVSIGSGCVMMKPIREDHPLKRFFRGLVENAFVAELGLCNLAVLDYLTDLLAEFVHVDRLRAIRNAEGKPLEQTCRRFGFTRESYRQILERYRAEGMFGFFDRKRGRKNPLKIDNKVQTFLCREHTRLPELGADELAARCEKETGVSLSRRSVYRVLSKVREKEKKKRHRRASSAH